MSVFGYPSSTQNTLLNYGVTTFPSPLQVSPVRGEIAIVVSNGTADPIYCNEIRIVVPIGWLAQDLATSATSMQLAVLTPPGQWQFEAPTTRGQLTLRPTKPEYAEITTTGISLSVSDIQVNQQVGTFELDIAETSHAGSDGYQVRHGTWHLPKFPYGFSMSNFVASAAEVPRGTPVVLTWTGSENATYAIRHNESDWVHVDGRSWRSPALEETTVFELRATAGEDTVTYGPLSATVAVGVPTVEYFTAVPDQIDYGQAVTLQWRATNALGVYLTQTCKNPEQLPAHSGPPSKPKTLQPAYGKDYELQAYDAIGSSAATPLIVSFNPLQIVSFTADRTTVDNDNPAVTLAWEVLHAKSVSLDGSVVGATGSSVEHPVTGTTYDLVATWVDGTQHPAQPISVSVDGVRVHDISVSFEREGQDVLVTVTMTIDNAVSVLVESLLYFSKDTQYWKSDHHATSMINGQLNLQDSTQWVGWITFTDIPKHVFYKNRGLNFKYTIEGLGGGSDWDFRQWRGSFDGRMPWDNG